MEWATLVAVALGWLLGALSTSGLELWRERRAGERRRRERLDDFRWDASLKLAELHREMLLLIVRLSKMEPDALPADDTVLPDMLAALARQNFMAAAIGDRDVEDTASALANCGNEWLTVASTEEADALLERTLRAFAAAQIAIGKALRSA